MVDSGGCGHELSGFLKGEKCLQQHCLRGVDCNNPPLCTLSAQSPCYCGTHDTAYYLFGRRASQGPFYYDLMVFSWSIRKPLRIYFATTTYSAAILCSTPLSEANYISAQFLYSLFHHVITQYSSVLLISCRSEGTNCLVQPKQVPDNSSRTVHNFRYSSNHR